MGMKNDHEYIPLAYEHLFAISVKELGFHPDDVFGITKDKYNRPFTNYAGMNKSHLFGMVLKKGLTFLIEKCKNCKQSTRNAPP